MDKHDIPTRLGVNSLRFSYRIESDYPGENESTSSLSENTLRIAHSDPLYGAMRIHGWINTPAGPASDLVLTQTIINTVDTAAILFTDPDLITFTADIETTTWNLQNTSSIDVDGVLLPPISDLAAITWEVADIQDVSLHGSLVPPSSDLEAITWTIADIQDVSLHGSLLPLVSDLTATSISASSIDVQASTSSTLILPTQAHNTIITNSDSDLSFQGFAGSETEILPREELFVGRTIANDPGSERTTILSFALPSDMGVSTVIESAKIQFTATGPWTAMAEIDLDAFFGPAGHQFTGGSSNWFSGVLQGTGPSSGFPQIIDNVGVIAGQRDDQTAMTDLVEAIYGVISHTLYTQGDNLIFRLAHSAGAHTFRVAAEEHALYDAPALSITYTP